MDDPAQKPYDQNNSQQPVQPQSPAVQAGQGVVSQQPPQAPVAPSGHKEVAPAMHAEYVQPAPHEAEPVLDEEVASHVETKQAEDQPQLTQEHRDLGISESHADKQAPTQLSDDAQFPLTHDQVVSSQSSTYSDNDSFKWFGRLVKRQIERLHVLFKGKGA